MKKSNIIRVIVLLILLAIISFVTIRYRHLINIENLQRYLSNLNTGFAPFIFIGIYAIATILFLPGAILTLSGGLVFGAWWGTLYNLIAAVIGAGISFLIARFIAADWVAQKAGGKLKSLIDGVEDEGWKFVAIVRLMPILPFNILNYALGLTRIRFWQYIVASFIFMAPGCFAYTYLGSLGQSVIHGEGRKTLGKIFIAIGILLFVSCIPWIIKKVKGKQDEQQ